MIVILLAWVRQESSSSQFDAFDKQSLPHARAACKSAALAMVLEKFDICFYLLFHIKFYNNFLFIGVSQ